MQVSVKSSFLHVNFAAQTGAGDVRPARVGDGRGRQGRGGGGGARGAAVAEPRDTAARRARARPRPARRLHQLGLPLPGRHGHRALRPAVPRSLLLLPLQVGHSLLYTAFLLLYYE